ncbi:tetratricopeptide repeat protein [Gynuella sunshinyii]|uniref:Tfp pilus assembly protein PilF n=1 Tax=Gynuella sunshinyii YC6258 TaxID=1445510 RepID=A0A0C5VLJ2_9GAMM|nr:tetratricopeptide repeat protein [Gynuella sunshinyii]AJQ94198.1 tfp pilus assembly protein PilF [Gynuella sunshinyii YC6258]
MAGKFDNFHKIEMLLKHGRVRAATQFLYEQLEKYPDRIEPVLQLGAFYRRRKKYDLAKIIYERGLRKFPKAPALLSNYGNLLTDLKEFDLAEVYLLRARSIHSSHDIVRNLGLHYFHRGKPKEALALFELLVEDQPDNADYHWHRALCLLHLKRFKEGWEAYEWRTQLHPNLYPTRKYKKWCGENLSGKTICVTLEQGLGDALNFLRFVPLLHKLGAVVFLESKPVFEGVFKCISGVQLIDSDERVESIDYYVPIMSLPFLLGLTTENQLFELDQPLAIKERTAFSFPSSGKKKVGLIWAGKKTPKDRSCDLSNFNFLFFNSDIQVYSFQFDSRKSDIEKNGYENFIIDLSSHIYNFYETALLLKEMDYVITVDTSAAHLAGLIGVPVKLMLLHYSDWRWFEGKSTPWYPAMTLYRQHQPDDWSQAILELRRDLEMSEE